MANIYKELSNSLIGNDKLEEYLQKVSERLNDPKKFNEAMVFLYRNYIMALDYGYTKALRKEYYDEGEKRKEAEFNSYMAVYDWLQRED